MIRAKTAAINNEPFKLDALPDPADFRDRLFVPTLTEVPVQLELDRWLEHGLPVGNQGVEGSCTGFALMTVAHYLLRSRRIAPDVTDVSPRMFYEMAKRYDEWPGEEYEGSSARGAMKGWHKHGACAEVLWPSAAAQPDRELTNERANDALARPLGAYYRVNHKDLVSMHNAIAEAGVLFVTAVIHSGWLAPDEAGTILQQRELLGGHAFVIVGYNSDGFWLQSSWGEQWGRRGCALLTYDDWLANAMDVWVARLGVPVRLQTPIGTAAALSQTVTNRQAQPLDTVRPHVIRIDRDGKLLPTGAYATTEADVARIFDVEIPRLTRDWKQKRLLLYAHSGLDNERDGAQKAVRLATTLTGDQIYPLLFVWRTDFLSVVQKVLQEALDRRQPEDAVVDYRNAFMLDRLDSALEPLARTLSGQLLWNETKQIGELAMRNEQAGCRIVLKHLVRFLAENPAVELHIVAHGAGSVFFAPLVQLLTAGEGVKLEDGPMKGRTGLGLSAKTCTLWAPASTIRCFNQIYRPAVEQGAIGRFTVYTLSERAERADHCAEIYHKSFLYLVAHAFEETLRIPMLCTEGTPLLGLEEHIVKDPDLFAFLTTGPGEWVVAPNSLRPEDVDSSGATSHVAFDSDPATLFSTVARIMGVT